MHILVDKTGALSLHDCENFKQFHISAPSQEDLRRCNAFSEISKKAEDEHYWLDADAIVSLSGRSDDQDWLNNFWTMLEKVEAFGYADISQRLVKAHCEFSADSH